MQNIPLKGRDNDVESKCPSNCTSYGFQAPYGEALTEDEFIIDANGKMCVIKNGTNCKKTKKVEHFCLSYFCNPDGIPRPAWEVRAHACECDKTDKQIEEDAKDKCEEINENEADTEATEQQVKK